VRRTLFAVVVAILSGLVVQVTSVSAHAQPERAAPPINGSVPVAPAKLEIWFTEDVATTDLRVTVKAPDGTAADQGDAALDLFDLEHRHVTLSLKPNLGPGTYVVTWHTVSGIDGDAADGFFSFSIVPGSPVASPSASPAATPAGTPIAATPAGPASSIAIEPTATATPVADDSNFDSRAFGLAVLAGVVVAIGIYLFWRLVRPKPVR
jgi:copper transport protein